jgi:phenylalanyl-tRNA synthetase alpha chain
MADIQLQQLILDRLDAHGSLPDTRTLTIPGATSPATDAESQITILGALNSLLSREVPDLPLPVAFRFRTAFALPDDLL